MLLACGSTCVRVPLCMRAVGWWEMLVGGKGLRLGRKANVKPGTKNKQQLGVNLLQHSEP